MSFFPWVKSTHAVNHKIHIIDNCRFCNCSHENNTQSFCVCVFLNNSKTLPVFFSLFLKRKDNFIRHYLSFSTSLVVSIFFCSFFIHSISERSLYSFYCSLNSHGKWTGNAREQLNKNCFIISQWGDVSFQSFYGF